MKKLVIALVVIGVSGFFALTPRAGDKPESWSTLFPDGLKDVNGKDIKLETLKGKTVGVYFSAHWCPPCRAFTPKLVAFRDGNRAAFEVVFVSADRSAEAQNKYMKDTGMKWPAVPFDAKSKSALSKKYSVSGIPALIILGKDGSVITKNGRDDVARDPNAALSKWQKSAASK